MAGLQAAVLPPPPPRPPSPVPGPGTTTSGEPLDLLTVVAALSRLALSHGCGVTSLCDGESATLRIRPRRDRRILTCDTESAHGDTARVSSLDDYMAQGGAQ